MNLGSLQPQSGVSSVSTPVTQTEIIEMVLALPYKQCLSDPRGYLRRASTCLRRSWLVVLLVPRTRRCSVEYEVRIHYADSKEG